MYSGYTLDFLKHSISTFHSSNLLSFFGTGSVPEKKLMYGFRNGDISFCLLSASLDSVCFFTELPVTFCVSATPLIYVCFTAEIAVSVSFVSESRGASLTCSLPGFATFNFN